MPLVPMVITNEGGQERSFDIYSRLLRDRIIMCQGQVEDNMASLIVAQLLYLQSEDAKQPIHLYVNSPGGSVISGLSIISTMNLLSCPVYTYGMGQCCSMGLMIVSSGEKGYRYSLPNTRYMGHTVSSGTEGHIADMKIAVEETDRLNEILMEMLSKNTGKDIETIKKDMDRDLFMSEDEAVAYGLIDKVLKK